MENKELQDQPQVQEVAEEQVQPKESPNINVSMEQLSEIVAKTVEATLKSSQSKEFREKAEDYNKKMTEVINSSHSSMMKPSADVQNDALAFVKKVFADDEMERKKHPEGRNLMNYKDPLTFLKTKIMAYKRSGLNDEEIAKLVEDENFRV